MSISSPPLSERASLLVDAAMRLFSDTSYAETSVADIQVAAGLAKGSGGLYKHFASKEEVLVAGIERHIAMGRRQASGLDPSAIEPDAEGLSALGSAVLDQLGRDRATLRIICRDLEPFPELRSAVLHERIQPIYGVLGELLDQAAGVGIVRPLPDPQAAAAVLLGALTLYRLFEALLDEAPGQVSQKRFVAAWADLTAAALTPSQHTGAEEP